MWPSSVVVADERSQAARTLLAGRPGVRIGPFVSEGAGRARARLRSDPRRRRRLLLERAAPRARPRHPRRYAGRRAARPRHLRRLLERPPRSDRTPPELAYPG